MAEVLRYAAIAIRHKQILRRRAGANQGERCQTDRAADEMMRRASTGFEFRFRFFVFHGEVAFHQSLQETKAEVPN